MTDLQLGELVEAFELLDELRVSGRTNMFGAGVYLQSELNWSRRDAREALGLWMDTFDKERTADERAASAIEARSDATPQSGAAEGESAVPQADAQTDAGDA